MTWLAPSCAGSTARSPRSVSRTTWRASFPARPRSRPRPSPRPSSSTCHEDPSFDTPPRHPRSTAARGRRRPGFHAAAEGCESRARYRIGRLQREEGRRIGDAIAAGYLFTRNLQMQPGNVCTPSYLAEQARKLGATHGFSVTILDKAQIKTEGMGALLAVAQGSAEEPRFIVLEYQGGSGAPVALIGKGVTFDSGGISIKPPQNMDDMNFYKSGATAVLGSFEVLGLLKPKINVVGLIRATEDLPSGTAIKPGDVVKSHLGKTIEIINTDAEGRLILCDALSYARRF